MTPDLPFSENEVSLYGTTIPKSLWNLNSNPYNFSGSASNSNLYSNYLLVGKTNVTVKVENKGSNTLTVLYKRHRWGIIPDETITTKNIPVGVTMTFTVSGLGISNDYYLQFNAPNNFSGCIK